MATFWPTFHHDGKISPARCRWGCTPTPFHYISTITYKVVVHAYAEGAETLSLFLLCVEMLGFFTFKQR
jgi:hypothetical protein